MENFTEDLLPELVYKDLIESLPRGTSSEVAEMLELSTSRVSQILHDKNARHRIQEPLRAVIRRKIQKLQKFVDEPPIASFIDHTPEGLEKTEQFFQRLQTA